MLFPSKMILSTNTFQLLEDVLETLTELAFVDFLGTFFFKKTTFASVLNKLTDFKCTFSPDKYNCSPLALRLPIFTVLINPDSSSIIFQFTPFTANSLKAKSKVSALEDSVDIFVGMDGYKRKFIFPPLSVNLSR